MLAVILLTHMNTFPRNLKKGLTVQNFGEYSQVTSDRVKFSCAFCLYVLLCRKFKMNSWEEVLKYFGMLSRAKG